VLLFALRADVFFDVCLGGLLEEQGGSLGGNRRSRIGAELYPSQELASASRACSGDTRSEPIETRSFATPRPPAPGRYSANQVPVPPAPMRSPKPLSSES